MLQLVYIIFIMQPLALGFTKLAFLFFYRRIFVWAGFQKISLVFIILTASFTLAFFFGFIFDCGLNFAANWGSLASIGEKCPFGFQATIIFTIIDAALDFFILVLPLPWVCFPRVPASSIVPIQYEKAPTIDPYRSGTFKWLRREESNSALSSCLAALPSPQPPSAW
jgi:hypothetical protein